MKLCDVYQAATKRVMLNHHNVGSDVTAAITVAPGPSIWTGRNLGLSSLDGLYLLSEQEEVIQQNLQTAMESVNPPFHEGWVEPRPGPPASKRPNPGPDSGPEARASADKARLAEYWDLHYSCDFMRKVVEWSIFYAASQTAKLVRASKGQRHVFLPCPTRVPMLSVQSPQTW